MYVSIYSEFSHVQAQDLGFIKQSERFFLYVVYNNNGMGIYINTMHDNMVSSRVKPWVNVLCYGPTKAKMSGDVLATKKTCSGGDGCRCRTCGPTRKLTRDVLTNLRGACGEASPMHRRIFGDNSALHRLTVSDVLLKSATVGNPPAMRRGVMAMS